MQKDNFPKIPPLPHITGKELFEDDKKAEEWFHALALRRAALANLIASTQASMYSKDGSPDAEEFVIVSPCTDGVYRYQLTKFDKFGPVYDEKRNDKREIAKGIPNSYVVVEEQKGKGTEKSKRVRVLNAFYMMCRVLHIK